MKNIFVLALMALLALMTQQYLVEDQLGHLHHYRGGSRGSSGGRGGGGLSRPSGGTIAKWGSRGLGGVGNVLGLAN